MHISEKCVVPPSLPIKYSLALYRSSNNIFVGNVLDQFIPPVIESKEMILIDSVKKTKLYEVRKVNLLSQFLPADTQAMAKVVKGALFGYL